VGESGQLNMFRTPMPSAPAGRGAVLFTDGTSAVALAGRDPNLESARAVGFRLAHALEPTSVPSARRVADHWRMSTDAKTDLGPAPGSLLTKVPGRARPQRQVLAEFNEYVAELRQRYKPVFWFLFIPKAEDMYRWRVQLECGCTREVFTYGSERFPDQGSDTDPFTGHRLPTGELWCSADHGPAQRGYRDIVEWIKNEVKEFPADPEEPEHELDGETWALVRHAEPHSSAFLTVKLTCGHVSTSVIAEVGWTPEEGPRLVSEERAEQMLAEFEAFWSDPDHHGWPREGSERDHVRKMIELRWPRPEPEQECSACIYAKRITGYQRMGWLVPRKPPAPAQKPAVDRKKLEARLASAEAEVQRLRKQLDNSGNA
jgi:hypothetical protein